jgi:hypothetical protein
MSGPNYQLPPALDHLRTEIETYYRALPRLLGEEQEGRYVLIRGTELFEVWDTFRDAIQYGHEKFGDRNFLVQDVSPRYLEPLSQLFGPVATGEVA